MENFICNQYGETFAILNTENIKICSEAIKMQFVCFFFHICRKFEVLISEGSVATYLRWGGYCHMGFVANFVRFPVVQKFWKSVKIWLSYRQLKCGNFFETQCTSSHGDVHWTLSVMGERAARVVDHCCLQTAVATIPCTSKWTTNISD